MSSNKRKKDSEKKNSTKKKSPVKTRLEELRDNISDNILKTADVFTEIKGTEVAKDNQIIKYILKERVDQPEVEQAEPESEQNETIQPEPEQEPERPLLKRSLDNDPKYKNTFIHLIELYIYFIYKI